MSDHPRVRLDLTSRPDHREKSLIGLRNIPLLVSMLNLSGLEWRTCRDRLSQLRALEIGAHVKNLEAEIASSLSETMEALGIAIEYLPARHARYRMYRTVDEVALCLGLLHPRGLGRQINLSSDAHKFSSSQMIFACPHIGLTKSTLVWIARLGRPVSIISAGHEFKSEDSVRISESIGASIDLVPPGPTSALSLRRSTRSGANIVIHPDFYDYGREAPAIISPFGLDAPFSDSIERLSRYLQLPVGICDITVNSLGCYEVWAKMLDEPSAVGDEVTRRIEAIPEYWLGWRGVAAFGKSGDI